MNLHVLTVYHICILFLLNKKTYTYSPSVCTPILYKFTYIYDHHYNKFKVQLFEHEFIKHGTCMDNYTSNYTTTNYLDKAIYLHNNYYNRYVNDNCIGYDQLWITLDENFSYVSTECVK
jgi:hypothetical protein